MAKKPDITTIASGYYSRQALNTNFTNLQDGFDNTLSLDGSTPNSMGADLDMNSNDILNAGTVNTSILKLDGTKVAAGDLSATGATLASDSHTGNGSTTAFSMSYDPFIKDNTQVYIDGVYQEKSTYSISGTTLTFSEAPPLNAGIEIVVTRTLDFGADDAANVNYTQGGTGSVNRTVLTKLQETVSVKDFGAVGDGVTDDTTALTNAITAASGKVLDGGNQTYKITSAITATSENIVIQNMTIDTSATSGAFENGFINFTGTLGGSQTLTSNTSALSDTVVVADTSSFSADTYAYMASSLDFQTSQSVTLGQIVKIKSVDSATQLTLYEEVLYSFNTSDTATISPLTTKSNITFRNVRFVGANDTTNSQTALQFENCENVVVDNCSFEFYSYTSVRLSRCINSVISNTSSKYARKSGLSYGFAIHNACYSVSIDSCYGEDHRHMVTVGDNDGVNLFIRVSNCHAASQRDAGIDAHSACDYMVIEGNTIEGIDAGTDGIIYQGISCNITNNIVVGNFSEAIRVQSLPNIGEGAIIVSGNSINNIGTSGTDAGIFLDFSGGGVLINSSNVSNNSFEGDMNYHVYVYNSTGSEDMQNIAISGNVSSDNATGTGIYLRTASGGGLYNTSINGNVIKGSGSNGIYLQGGGSNEIRRVAVSGNTITGFTNGCRLTNVQDIVISGNMNDCNVRTLVATSTGVVVDQSQSTPTTVTDATYTLDDDDLDLIANRAGTVTLTLSDASAWAGRVLNVKTIQAQTVVSASSNVVPIDSATAGTAILPATDGAWAQLRSDGTNWIIMQKG